jgi:5-methylcytosine-specific restriction enzyme A
MGMKRYKRFSNSVTRTRRWKALRLEALRRDEFRCVKCDGRNSLEVDHIKSVRSAPDRAFDLSNLQVLCKACHTAKTRIEVGHEPLSPNRQAWRILLQNTRLQPNKQEIKNA